MELSDESESLSIPIVAQHSDADGVAQPQTASNATRNSRYQLQEAQETVWKKALRCEVVYLTFISLILIASLISDWNSECKGHHLKLWIFMAIPLNLLLLIPNVLLQFNLKSFFHQAETRSVEAVGGCYMASRILNLIWIIWSIVGMFWTFPAGVCADSIPAVYFTCFLLALVNVVVIGLPLLLCCLSIPGGVIAYLFFPRVFGKENIKKASPKMIKKHTRLEKFTDGMVSLEDRCCAICLCDYMEGDDIRFLHCNHHFHSECVTDWLMRNKTCPFCKAEIDKMPPKRMEVRVDIPEEEIPLSAPDKREPST